MSSEESKIAKVKHCTCSTLPTPKKTALPPPPLSDLASLPSGLPPPPSFPDIPYSVVTKKSIPATGALHQGPIWACIFFNEQCPQLYGAPAQALADQQVIPETILMKK